MKKSLIFATTGLTLLAGVTTTVLLNNASAETTGATTTLADLTDQTTLGTSLSTTKDETVYVITDNSGAPTKTFIGNILETSENNLPLELKITYTLDGREVPADQISGKSGHIKVTYQTTSTKSYQGKLVPFLTLTGLQLDSNKFQNLKLENAKIISDGDTIMLAGYTLAGLNSNFNTDLLPDFFTIEADVTDFELETTYTLATNEIFAELDTSKLSTADDLVNSMNQLGTSIDQILAGSESLNDGISQLSSGIATLQSGATALNSGASELATGASDLSAGLTELTTYNDSLTTGATTVITSTIQSLAAEGVTVTTDNYADVLELMIASLTATLKTLPEGSDIYNTLLAKVTSLTQAKGLLDLSTGIIGYTAGVSQAASGAADLSAGANELLSGTTALKSGADQLASGATQLQSGSQTLATGIATFKSEGIDKLVSFANNDLASFTANARSTVSTAKSYHSYKSASAESVKFIFKTPSIK